MDPVTNEAGAFHHGIDMSGSDYDIYSIGEGTVYETGKTTLMGNYIVIDHNINGEYYSSIYMHIADSGIKVSPGDNVSSNTIIALMGSTGKSTGIHLHLGMYKGLYGRGGEEINPREVVDFPDEERVYFVGIA